MFPLEFTFEGPPLSLQSKNKARKFTYKQMIEAAAKAVIPADTDPCTEEVEVTITYYFEGDTPDVDNIIKPIQDALIGTVYIDDNQIADTRSRKRDINGSYRIRSASAVLLQAFSTGTDFIHVKIDLHQINNDL